VIPLDPSTYPDTIWSCTTNNSHSHPVLPTAKLTKEQKALIDKTISKTPNTTVDKVIKCLSFLFPFFSSFKLIRNSCPPELGLGAGLGKDELPAVWRALVESQVKKVKKKFNLFGEGMEGWLIHCSYSTFLTRCLGVIHALNTVEQN
jgi:hypothetical protein